ncbi:MAG: MFS transporter [Planctomycetota bacterium]
MPAAMCSGLFFFLILYGYFLIRPVREAMGVQRSMADLRWLFVVTCAVSLVVTLLFGSAVSRFDRTRFIPRALRLVSLCLLVFAVLLAVDDSGSSTAIGYVFYVWLSVVNLFMVSVFWAFMNDVWTLEQGKRVFPAIAVGGTLGALLASVSAWQLADVIGAGWQMVVAAVVFELAVRAMRAVHRRDRSGTGTDSRPTEIGGRWIDGLFAVIRSGYLRGIGAYIALMTVGSTLLYFTQARLVIDASEELESRIGLFAQLDVWTQAATLLAQLFLTGRLIRWIGVGWTLAILPALTLVGFAGLAYVASIDGIEGWQVFAVFALFNASHRATRYAIARPARETLFGVLNRREKYKAKPIVDVFVYRGGDVAGTGLDTWLAGLGAGLAGVAVFAGPMALLWCGLGLWLARVQAKASKGLDRKWNGSVDTDRGDGLTPGGVGI